MVSDLQNISLDGAILHSTNGPGEGCCLRIDLSISVSASDFQFFSVDDYMAKPGMDSRDVILAVLGAFSSL